MFFYLFIFRYRRVFLDLVEQVTQKINTFSSINDEIYDDDVSIKILKLNTFELVVHGKNILIY